MKAHFFRVLQEKEGIDALFLGKQEKYLRIRQLIDRSFVLLADLYAALNIVTEDGTTSMTQKTPREVLFRAVCPTREIHEQILYYYNVFLSEVKDELDKLGFVVDSIEEKDSKIEIAVTQNLVNYFTQVIRQQFCHPEISWPSIDIDIDLKHIIQDKNAERLEKCEAVNRKVLQREFLRERKIIFSTKALYKSCGII